MEFKQRPVLMSEDEMKKLGRRIRRNCAAKKTLRSPWFRYPVAAAVGVASLFAADHFFPIENGLAEMARNDVCIIPLEIGILFGGLRLGEQFDRRMRLFGARYLRQARRLDRWKKWQLAMTHRVCMNVDESRFVRSERAAAAKGGYQIPMVYALNEARRHNDLTPGVDRLFPTGMNVVSRADWKAFSRNARLKLAIAEGIGHRRLQQAMPQLPREMIEKIIGALALG